MQENLTTKKRGNPRRYYAMQFYDWLESVKDPGSFFGNDYPTTTPGTSHGRAYTFGYLAGKNAAKG